MLLTRTVAPSDLLSSADIKAHLRIDHSYDDTTLDAIRSVVAAYLDGREGYLSRALLTQTWTLSLCEFPPSREIHLPMPPLQSVTSITYYDGNDTQQTLSSDNYYVYTAADPGYIKLKLTGSWPATYERDDAVTVTFVAGYGAASAVPVPIKQAALLLAGKLYANRGDGETTDVANVMSDPIRALLANYRMQLFRPAHEQNWS